MKALRITQLIVATITIITGVLFLIGLRADWNPVFEYVNRSVFYISALVNSVCLLWANRKAEKESKNK